MPKDWNTKTIAEFVEQGFSTAHDLMFDVVVDKRQLDQALSIIAHLTAEREEGSFILKKFGEWYNENDCPWSEGSFCPRFDELKADYDDEAESRPAGELWPFDPKEACGTDMEGGCYVEYYRKQYHDKKAKEITP